MGLAVLLPVTWHSRATSTTEGTQGLCQVPGSPSFCCHRTDVVSVVDTYQYEDPQDVFSREPFILRVSAPSTSKWGNKWPWVVAWGGRGADIPLPWQR